MEDWIDGQFNYLEVHKHLEPLIDDQNQLVRNAAENFEFQLDAQDEFIQDPFRIKLIEPGTYLVFILEKYVDWDYFSSSDMGKFCPTSTSDTHGFRAFLNDWIAGSAQDKLDRELRRQKIKEKGEKCPARLDQFKEQLTKSKTPRSAGFSCRRLIVNH